MIIDQAFVSNSLSSFRERFLKRYGLANYYSTSKPAVFFGCYKKHSDHMHIAKHQSVAIIVYGGSDAWWLWRFRKHKLGIKYLRLIKNKPNTFHIAISKFISNDLRVLGIPHICLPVCPTSPGSANAQPLGTGVYYYSSHARPEVYNQPLINEIVTRLPKIKFIGRFNQPPNHDPISIMSEHYRNAFIGLRLNIHDGLSNTVMELGLMGRRCIWNGGSPNAIPWHNSDDVVNAILSEQKLIGTTNPTIAEATRKYLDIGNDWLDTDFYGTVNRKNIFNTII